MMARFAFKAYDGAGRMQHGELDAESQRTALDVLSRRGLFAVEVIASVATSERRPWWQRDLLADRRLPRATLASLARELAVLTKARLPIDEALGIAALQPRTGRRTRHLLLSVQQRVIEGSSLSEALAQQGGAIPEYYWRLVSAGESGGNLPGVLEELAVFLEQSEQRRSQLLTAMLYPMVLFLAAAAALGVVLVVLMPAILPLFRDAGVEPPLLLGLLAGGQDALVRYWPLTLAATAFLLAALLWMGASPYGLELRDRLALRLPVVASLVQQASTARFARTLAMLLHNGVPMLEALQIVAGVMSNRSYRKAVRDAEQQINRGGSLVQSLTSSGLFPELALRFVALGESGGSLPVMLARAADIYEQSLRRQLERMLALATPLVTIVIGGSVGLLMLTVLSAMLGLNETVLR